MNAVEMIAEAAPQIKNTVSVIGKSGIDDSDKDLILEWLVYLRINRNLSPNTVANYGTAQIEFAEFLKNLDDSEAVSMLEAGPRQADEWHKFMAMDRLKEQTRSMRLSGMRSFYKWADYKELCVSRMHTVIGPKRAQPLPRTYTNRELQEFMASCDRSTAMGQRDYAVLMFFVSTGARRCEAEKLCLADVELSTKVGGVMLDGKGAKERFVAFEGPVVEALREWLHTRDELANGHDSVFVAINGRTKGEPLGPDGLDGIIGRVAKCSGNESEGLHKLRTWFATNLYEQTRDIEQVRVTLGHNDINTTRRYIAISPSARSSRMSAATLQQLTGVNDEQTQLPRWINRQSHSKR